MKILQIFGAVVAVHLLAFIFIFASPGCQSGPRNIPTPDATMPTGAAVEPVTFTPTAPQPVDLGTSTVGYNPASPAGHAAPTRPGSANAVAIMPAKATAEVAPVSTYTVGKGDSLWTIAKKNHLTVAELAKANNLPVGAALQPGKKLIIPGKPGAAPAPATDKPRDLGTLTQATSAAAKPANGEVVKHTVAVGESLGIIARKYQVTLGELAAANNITDPSKVRAGQQLIIPGFKAVGTKGTTTAASTAKGGTTKAAPPETATATPAATPHFEIAPPPPGQDLDSGLKNAGTEVPTIKVEDAKPTPPKN
ncbi:LysM peptidoglycan-binding domain-containing protein [Opitutus sp. GAS368]|jgi:LysM repeat protein|uniref:muramidase family protein n=1 Tax=Opitutus sp. GAS368 TaxID=1882749 RepID=UPI00087A70D7|nr:LysM peptidoglycan-binding domain-containing protein [Opitutus sp. GAS368]SDR67068.1 LysM repeat-containing protein [Opitutus sp. GAS368]